MFGIIGLGSVGTLLAYFLNKAGHVPYVITRSPAERRIVIQDESVEVKVKQASEFPRSIKYTFICVKANDTRNILDRVVGLPVSFQNGIGSLELIRENLGTGYPVVVTYGARRYEGIVEVTGVGELVMPMELREVGDTLRLGGANVVYTNNIDGFRWLKTLVNSAINPITTILEAPNRVIIEDPYARVLAMEVISEGSLVVRRIPVDLPRDPWDEALRVARITGDNTSSMLQDMRNNRPTEIDYINGAIIRYGESMGIPTPINKALHLIVKAMETTPYSARARGRRLI